MKILCLFSRYPNFGDTSIAKDLTNALYKLGHEVSVITLLEKKFNKKTHLQVEDGCNILRVRTGNMFDTVSKYEKFFTTITAPYHLFAAIKKYCKNDEFDLIITHTPFVADPTLIKKLKNLYQCQALLILWDIFPQNAVDLGMMKKRFLYLMLKRKEQKMLRIFDVINCMSEGNERYMLKHYPYLSKDKLIVNQNWAAVTKQKIVNRVAVRKKYNYKEDDKICIFGGNIGKPQAIENLVFMAKKLPNFCFLFVGKGTELKLLQILVKELSNVKILDYLDRTDYEELISACDVGLVSLDARFTVPNFPSKTIDYLKCDLPIFALLDDVSANDYGEFLLANNLGRYIHATKLEQDYVKLMQMFKELGKYKSHCRCYFEHNLDVMQVASKFVECFNNKNLLSYQGVEK